MFYIVHLSLPLSLSLTHTLPSRMLEQSHKLLFCPSKPWIASVDHYLAVLSFPICDQVTKTHTSYQTRMITLDGKLNILTANRTPSASSFVHGAALITTLCRLLTTLIQIRTSRRAQNLQVLQNLLRLRPLALLRSRIVLLYCKLAYQVQSVPQ